MAISRFVSLTRRRIDDMLNASGNGPLFDPSFVNGTYKRDNARADETGVIGSTVYCCDFKSESGEGYLINSQLYYLS